MRLRRVLGIIAAAVGGLIVLAVIAVVVWSQVGVLRAEPGPLADVTGDPRVTLTDASRGIVLEPAAGRGDVGFVFVPGGKVEAEAYVATLAPLVVDHDVTVVITRPWLNLALLDPRGLDTFTDLAPDVDAWLVGGHSLGGVRACGLVDDADALVLLASYCARDISTATVPVLSVAGEHDALSTPDTVAAEAHLLPPTADLVVVPGASHASFGRYGPQPGDGTPTITDEEMAAELTALLAGVVAQVG